jgi:hypothetical protein
LHPKSSLALIRESLSSDNCCKPSPRTSRRIRLANLLTRDRERKLTAALNLGIPYYSLTADDPWVDRIKRLSTLVADRRDGVPQHDDGCSDGEDDDFSWAAVRAELQRGQNRMAMDGCKKAGSQSGSEVSGEERRPVPKPRQKAMGSPWSHHKINQTCCDHSQVGCYFANKTDYLKQARICKLICNNFPFPAEERELPPG